VFVKVQHPYVNFTTNCKAKAIGVSSQINVKIIRICTFTESILPYRAFLK
jgi:hypothetical protein